MAMFNDGKYRILQIISATNMVAVFEEEDHQETESPVTCLALLEIEDSHALMGRTFMVEPMVYDDQCGGSFCAELENFKELRHK